MTRKAVLICPGRGTYNSAELGYLGRHHRARAGLIGRFDAIRADSGKETVTALDGVTKFSVSKYSRGDVASPLICACSLADTAALADDIEVVAVTGNSMGWYLALAAGGALTPEDGFRVVDTMGSLMQEHLIGGQLVYPWMGEDWRADMARKTELLALAADINARTGHALHLSIDLGGMLVLAGDEAGLTAFEAAVPPVAGRFPMRLANHAAFHTAMQAPVAEMGRTALPASLFGQPKTPLIDGLGSVWWPHATDTQALWRYTFDTQVCEAYDFTAAIRTAAREFAPNLFIVTGPGATLGGAVAQSLVLSHWKGMTDKAGFEALQARENLLVSMGREDQRGQVT